MGEPGFWDSTGVMLSSALWLACTVVFMNTSERPTEWAMFVCMVLSSWLVFYVRTLEQNKK